MDSDKVLVMSFGSKVEFDHPYKLLQCENGYFKKLLQETDPATSSQLRDMACQAFYKNERNKDD